jgi:hypothetical protein
MRAQNAVKSAYRVARRVAHGFNSSVPPLKKWARQQAGAGGRLAIVCRQWLSNKGCRA